MGTISETGCRPRRSGTCERTGQHRGSLAERHGRGKGHSHRGGHRRTGTGPDCSPGCQQEGDGTGAVLARVYSGKYGDGASGPVKRKVRDHSPVSGIRDKSGEATQFGFAYGQLVNGSRYYFMDVRRAHGSWHPTAAPDPTRSC
jgi:hypothetical protein